MSLVQEKINSHLAAKEKEKVKEEEVDIYEKVKKD